MCAWYGLPLPTISIFSPHLYFLACFVLLHYAHFSLVTLTLSTAHLKQIYSAFFFSTGLVLQAAAL
jgi:hypothetical protein